MAKQIGAEKPSTLNQETEHSGTVFVALAEREKCVFPVSSMKVCPRR